MTYDHDYGGDTGNLVSKLDLNPPGFLPWVMTNTQATGQLNLPLLRRLAVLKIWVDANGLHAGNNFWKPGHERSGFDPGLWLRDRSIDGFDEEDIGALADTDFVCLRSS